MVRGEGWNGAIYTIRVPGGRRSELRSHLDAQGIDTAIYYERPIHLQPALVRLSLPNGPLPESERAAGEVLSLPLYAEMGIEQRGAVIDAVRSFFR